MMVSALLWDVGGVLLRTEDPGPRRRWEERLGLPAGRLAKTVFECSAAQRATVGEASDDEVWREAANNLGVPPAELDQFKLDFFAGDRWDADLLRFIKNKRQALRMGILSNAWLGARASFAPWIQPDTFHATLFSAEEHLRKPDERFYRLAATRLGVAPETILFIDDFPENVEGARKIGMMGIQFMNSRSVMEYVSVILARGRI
jgi:glucose-1-phosphatase